MEEGLGTGLQDGLFSPPTRRGMSRVGGKEEADCPRNAAGHGATPLVASTKLGNRVFPSTCKMISPDL